jgi:hypothetical protein
MIHCTPTICTPTIWFIVHLQYDSLYTYNMIRCTLKIWFIVHLQYVHLQYDSLYTYNMIHCTPTIWFIVRTHQRATHQKTITHTRTQIQQTCTKIGKLAELDTLKSPPWLWQQRCLCAPRRLPLETLCEWANDTYAGSMWEWLPRFLSGVCIHAALIRIPMHQHTHTHTHIYIYTHLRIHAWTY